MFKKSQQIIGCEIEYDKDYNSSSESESENEKPNKSIEEISGNYSFLKSQKRKKTVTSKLIEESYISE